jgi:hypothetical protein
VLAICLLGGVLVSVLLAQVRPGTLPSAKARAVEDEWVWPKTLQVYPSHPGDPVKLVRILKDGKEVAPGTYTMPQIAGDIPQDLDGVKEWLKDASFTLKSGTSKTIVSLGMAVVFPVRNTDVECAYGGTPAPNPWCDAHPHWCDGGCPTLVVTTLHWGRIPPLAASGLEARYRAEAKGRYGDRALIQGEEWMRLAPGEEVTLSVAGRVDRVKVVVDRRTDFSIIMNPILYPVRRLCP